jgi:hypothetical protein
MIKVRKISHFHTTFFNFYVMILNGSIMLRNCKETV